MTNQPTLRELLDACRADQHDPQRPELAAELAPLARELQANPELQQQAERSERFDRSVRAALDDVTIPAELMERLLAGCEAATVTPAPAVDAETSKSARRFSRRQAIAIFSAAASLLIAVTGGLLFGDWVWRARPVSNDQLAQSAVTWFDQCGPAAQWSTAAAPTKEFPLDAALVFRPVRWRYLNDKRDAVVYEMRHESQRALLFVYQPKQPHPGLAKFPYSDLTASGGISLGAWQRTGVVYVLAVVGGNGRRPVDTFVRRPKFT